MVLIVLDINMHTRMIYTDALLQLFASLHFLSYQTGCHSLCIILFFLKIPCWDFWFTKTNLAFISSMLGSSLWLFLGLKWLRKPNFGLPRAGRRKQFYKLRIQNIVFISAVVKITRCDCRQWVAERFLCLKTLHDTVWNQKASISLNANTMLRIQ